jgi:hypothetical protein
MTKEEAVEIRRRQLWGDSVPPKVLAEAIQTIQLTALTVNRTRYKCRLPVIDPAEKERVNAILIENFKRALGEKAESAQVSTPSQLG